MSETLTPVLVRPCDAAEILSKWALKWIILSKTETIRIILSEKTQKWIILSKNGSFWIKKKDEGLVHDGEVVHDADEFAMIGDEE